MCHFLPSGKTVVFNEELQNSVMLVNFVKVCKDSPPKTIGQPEVRCDQEQVKQLRVREKPTRKLQSHTYIHNLFRDAGQ